MHYKKTILNLALIIFFGAIVFFPLATFAGSVSDPAFSGTFDQTQWDGGNSWVELANPTSNPTGSYTSTVKDAGAVTSWTNIAWTPEQPFYKELPDSGSSESGYPNGNANMGSNELLMHLNASSLIDAEDTSGNTNNGTVEDTYVKLLMHMDNTLLPDDSLSGHTVNIFSDVARNSAQSKYGGFSALFNASGDYLSLPASSDWDFSGGDFTIDFWFYINLAGIQQTLINSWVNYLDPDNWHIYITSANRLAFFSHGYTGDAGVVGTHDVTPDAWHHVAYVYDGTNVKTYLDGVLDASDGTAPGSNSDQAIVIGINDANKSTQPLYGYLDEVRLSKGIARWTSDFTPPEGAAGDVSWTTGELENALSFNGTNNWVAVPGDSSLDMTGNLTAEAWIYPTDLTQDGMIISKEWCDASSNYAYSFGYNSSGKLKFVSADTGVCTSLDEYESDSIVLTENEWNHVAAVHTNSFVTLYVNGSPVSGSFIAGSAASIQTNDEPLRIGVYKDVASYDDFFVGSMDELALFSRELSAAEIEDHYRRGANRLKFQVRTCDDAVCTTPGTWIGPDGTGSDYYTELSNTTTTTPSLNITNFSNTQYMQYQGIWETDNQNSSPELPSITLDFSGGGGGGGVPEFTIVTLLLALFSGVGIILLIRKVQKSHKTI
ncbi:LamG domain-containing protein [Patescibacteria group bacterium]|nr:LamG domain-containing protein [Patescibacteria group bacterium]MBU1963834.1 LamG domain-containing protein [Patescibacteria group bacterium]